MHTIQQDEDLDTSQYLPAEGENLDPRDGQSCDWAVDGWLRWSATGMCR